MFQLKKDIKLENVMDVSEKIAEKVRCAYSATFVSNSMGWNCGERISMVNSTTEILILTFQIFKGKSKSCDVNVHEPDLTSYMHHGKLSRWLLYNPWAQKEGGRVRPVLKKTEESLE